MTTSRSIARPTNSGTWLCCVLAAIVSLPGCGKEPAPTAISPIRINEVNPNNVSWEDSFGGTGDWIELYNLSDTSAELGGYFISDSKGNRYKHQFEAGTPGDAGQSDERIVIAAHDVLLLWADGQPSRSTPQAPHLAFKLSANGEGVWLSDSAGYLVDSVEFGVTPQNAAGTVTTSIARFPDGVGPFEWCSLATPEHPNGDRCQGEAL